MNHERFMQAAKALLDDDVTKVSDIRWRLEQAVEIIEEQDELLERIKEGAIKGCAQILRNVSGMLEDEE